MSKQSHKAYRRRDRDFLHRLQEVVEKEYTDRDFGLTRLAATMQISQRQVQRKLKVLTDCTPTEYLRNHRLMEALHYLRQGYPVGETAIKVGYSSQSYFASCFKTRYGLTPSEFQQQA